MTPPKLGRALAEALPTGEFVEIAGAGHMLMAEAPDETIDALAALLGAAAPSASAAG
jgi:pimeloyl-ACP methyl ester carboxylesterase